MKGRQIAVVGAAGGIGRALVDRLLREGAAVTGIDLPVSLARHPAPDGVTEIPIDLTDAASVDAAAGQLAACAPELSGCVVCSGFTSESRPLLDTSSETFDAVLLGNLSGTVRWARAVVPLLQKRPGGSLVHVASGLAQFIRPGYGPYSAAKAGLIAVTKTLALECAPGLRVNAVAPGAIDTAFLVGGTGRSDEQRADTINRAAYAANLPLQRIGQPDDVVGPLIFLLGPDSRYMTGQVLWINGGGYMP
jgi:NAD(P)-dependent dehydrogenase (short-subunit alcohol dehydrogenase family)